MSVPVHKLKKAEIVYLAKNHCQAHHHRYIEHYECYLREKPEEAPERIGFLDIEASNLDADWGIMLSWCIKDSLSDLIEEDVITKNDIRKGIEDKRIVESCIKAMQGYSRIVGYYSSRFDIPYIRARALINKIDFPTFGTIKHKDLYFAVRSKFKLSSRRLENACRQLLGETGKTKLDSKVWRNAARGDKASLEYIVEHNRWDVIDLEKLYLKINDFTKTNDTSI